MRVLVIGGGGREHALCWKLAQSPLVEELFCAPGNPGIARLAACVDGEPLEVARQVRADFVVVGPEVPLAAGLVDRLQEIGIAAFGPTQAAAQIEASKIFCKNLLRKYDIATGDFAAFESAAAARAHLRGRDANVPIVIKANGLAAGKGVVVAATRDEALNAVDELEDIALSHEAPDSRHFLIEECLSGEEVSVIALTDGETVVPLPPAQDHKRVGEGDTGPNTGGMGCYSPVPALSPQLYDAAIETILKPAVRALKAEGITYRGALYAGLMLTENGPQVLEFNCRFGDPETQVLLPRLQSDLLPLLLACAGVGAELSTLPCEQRDEAAVCVVLAAEGYPAADYRKGDVITGLDAAEAADGLVFHAGTSTRNGEIVTSGGRVLGVTALGDDFHAARAKCYDAVEKIHFEGAHYRRDIGWRCL
jgi:phosphoribosylamine--glycine ligase